jgi:hypothetical protein
VTATDLLLALEPVVAALEALGVRYYVAGSLASSAHGVPRASIDADLVADLRQAHVESLAARLQGAYYVDEERVRSAVQTRRSFNAIHLATMFKIDVFVAKGRPFDDEALDRARPRALEDVPEARQYVLASAEDTILAKLEWFRLGNEISDRQWADIVGMLKTGAERLDYGYLERWAGLLEVGDLLQRARRECEPGT